MTMRLAHIWRHPIKSHGVEALERVMLAAGRTLPWDRSWAVAHEASRADGDRWVPCGNFSRVSKAPGLMAISARLDERSERITLTHPDKPRVTLHPERDAETLIEWTKGLVPADRAQPVRVVRVPGRGMTDTPFPSISLLNLASNAAIGAVLRQDLDMRRWRGNLWIDGAAAWVEFDWTGKTLRIGGAELVMRERITRCAATTVDPDTGARDADTLSALKRGWGHQDMGIYLEVSKGGEIAVGDDVEVLG
ncbi:MAG: MOSC N-terminal beta barrel domain-containing protein [Pseudomonadota bacterium]